MENLVALKVKKISEDIVDFDFDTSQGELLSGKDELIQSLYLEIKQNKGQWWLGKFYGVPYINQPSKKGIAQVKNYDVSLYEAEYNKIFNARPDIFSYKYIVSELGADRVYRAEIELKTKYGTEKISI